MASIAHSDEIPPGHSPAASPAYDQLLLSRITTTRGGTFKKLAIPKVKGQFDPTDPITSFSAETVEKINALAVRQGIDPRQLWKALKDGELTRRELPRTPDQLFIVAVAALPEQLQHTAQQPKHTAQQQPWHRALYTLLDSNNDKRLGRASGESAAFAPKTEHNHSQERYSREATARIDFLMLKQYGESFGVERLTALLNHLIILGAHQKRTLSLVTRGQEGARNDVPAIANLTAIRPKKEHQQYLHLGLKALRAMNPAGVGQSFQSEPLSSAVTISDGREDGHDHNHGHHNHDHSRSLINLHHTATWAYDPKTTRFQTPGKVGVSVTAPELPLFGGASLQTGYLAEWVGSWKRPEIFPNHSLNIPIKKGRFGLEVEMSPAEPHVHLSWGKRFQLGVHYHIEDRELLTEFELVFTTLEGRSKGLFRRWCSDSGVNEIIAHLDKKQEPWLLNTTVNPHEGMRSFTLRQALLEEVALLQKIIPDTTDSGQTRDLFIQALRSVVSNLREEAGLRSRRWFMPVGVEGGFRVDGGGLRAVVAGLLGRGGLLPFVGPVFAVGAKRGALEVSIEELHSAPLPNPSLVQWKEGEEGNTFSLSPSVPERVRFVVPAGVRLEQQNGAFTLIDQSQGPAKPKGDDTVRPFTGRPFTVRELTTIGPDSREVTLTFAGAPGGPANKGASATTYLSVLTPRGREFFEAPELTHGSPINAEHTHTDPDSGTDDKDTAEVQYVGVEVTPTPSQEILVSVPRVVNWVFDQTVGRVGRALRSIFPWGRKRRGETH